MFGGERGRLLHQPVLHRHADDVHIPRAAGTRQEVGRAVKSYIGGYVKPLLNPNQTSSPDGGGSGRCPPPPVFVYHIDGPQISYVGVNTELQ